MRSLDAKIHRRRTGRSISLVRTTVHVKDDTWYYIEGGGVYPSFVHLGRCSRDVADGKYDTPLQTPRQLSHVNTLSPDMGIFIAGGIWVEVRLGSMI